jgi:ketosteroid isomerase-like protein
MRTTGSWVLTGALIAIAAIAVHHMNLPLRARPLAPQGSNDATSTLKEQIVAKEREGLDALKVGDVQHFADLTADDAVFVDPHGPAGKAQVMKNVAGFSLTDYQMEDVSFVQISPTAGLISYKSTEKGVSHGKEFAAQVYVSSVWGQRGGKWVCLFSQETAVRRALQSRLAGASETLARLGFWSIVRPDLGAWWPALDRYCTCDMAWVSPW